MALKKSVEILNSLRSRSGLFIAAPSPKTGYNKAWLRDNLYETYGSEILLPKVALNVMHKLLDIFLKYEFKVDHAIKEKPDASFKYVHARFHPETFDEFWEEWGNKQNDAVGFFLFRVADLENKGFRIIRGKDDLRILQKLVNYLASVEYWHDADNGVWEEWEEVHASSVGACVAGLREISAFVNVPAWLIQNGQRTLDELLPRESVSKDVDLALLSLIYPFNVVSESLRDEILGNVESVLVRDRGVIRYVGDEYYNRNGEAEWTMGLAWLAIIYKNLGVRKKYVHYLKQTLDCMNSSGELPELYFAGSEVHNDNSPLGWAQSLYLVAAL